MSIPCRTVPLLLLGLGIGGASPAQQPPSPQQPLRSVQSVVPKGTITAAAARIDALLERGLLRAGETALPIVDDATFVRRAYLEVVGRIPTLRETEAFLQDQATDKRHALVDRLLDSPGHTSHVANFWFDLLRVKSRLRQISGEPFAHWIRAAVQQDLPYDQFVRAMLTADGAAHERGKGATGYLLRDANMPHDAMANTLRLFLGTRLECAQCHNHPFDSWTQQDFYGMAAYFGGLRYRSNESPQQLAGLRQALANADERTRQQARQLVQRLGTGIAGSGSGQERLPADYKYDDAKPRSVVFARPLFGAGTKLAGKPTPPATRRPGDRLRERAGRPVEPEAGSRQALADWLCSPQNPRFTKVITNRWWARLFGRGLIEPVDDLKDESLPMHPELQQYLERLLVELKFDLRQFERVLLHTKLFQRATPTRDPLPDQPWRFAGPLLRRMSAEQLWDSLLTLVFDDLDQRLRDPGARAEEFYQRYEEVAGKPADELVAMLQNPRALLGNRPRPENQPRPATTAEGRALLQQLQQARRRNDLQRIGALIAELRQLGVPVPGEVPPRGREGDLLRASDLQQPAAPGHLLRQFGQSDREAVDGATTAANVPQVLTLLNGFLDQRVLQGASALRRDLEQTNDQQQQIRVAFLTTLNRDPTAGELAQWRSAIAQDGPDALRDLVWVLCNSNEFRFVR